MKKTLVISLIVFVVGLAIAIPIVISNRKSSTGSTPSKSDSKQEQIAKDIINAKEYDKKVPKFSLEISGKYSATVDNETFDNNVKVYQFDAGVEDYYGIHSNSYVGFKYSDLLKLLNISDYTSVTFESSRKSVSFRKEELDLDKTYIVFYRDGKTINNGKLNLLVVNYSYENSVNDLTRIVIN